MQVVVGKGLVLNSVEGRARHKTVTRFKGQKCLVLGIIIIYIIIETFLYTTKFIFFIPSQTLDNFRTNTKKNTYICKLTINIKNFISRITFKGKYSHNMCRPYRVFIVLRSATRDSCDLTPLSLQVHIHGVVHLESEASDWLTPWVFRFFIRHKGSESYHKYLLHLLHK